MMRTTLVDKKFILNIEKLARDVDTKRRRHHIPWKMVAAQSGVSETTLTSINRLRPDGITRSLDANTLIGVLCWLNQPLEKYIMKINTNKEGVK